MEPATAFLAHLRDLTASIGEDPDETDQCLTDAVADFTTAVPSYCSLQLTITQHTVPVVLTAVTANTHPDTTARTSLRLPLTLLGAGHDPGSTLILYASTPGAFVDLAADLNHPFTRPAASTPAQPGDGNVAAGPSPPPSTEPPGR